MIEWVYVVDLSGELLDESCVRKTKSLKPIESYLYNREPTLRFFPMALSNVRGFRPDEVPMLRLLRQDPSVQSSSSISTLPSMYLNITALVSCAWA